MVRLLGSAIGRMRRKSKLNSEKHKVKLDRELLLNRLTTGRSTYAFVVIILLDCGAC